MLQFTDNLGTWRVLGSIIPEPFSWSLYPEKFSSTSLLFRISYEGSLDKIGSYCYLRAIYDTENYNQVDDFWKRLYPKKESEIIQYPISPFFRFNAIPCCFEIQKRVRYLSFTGSSIESDYYSVLIEEFIPNDQ